MAAQQKSRPRGARSSSNSGLIAAGLLALVIVPLAGAAEPPTGRMVAAITAFVLLALAAVAGRRLHWGWLALLIGTAGLVAVRGQFAAIGPSLLVATALCLALWVCNRDGSRRNTDGRPRSGSPEHEAKLVEWVCLVSDTSETSWRTSCQSSTC